MLSLAALQDDPDVENLTLTLTLTLPLVFEATGAMGVETQKWWNDLVKMATEQESGNPTRSRRQLGLDHTWSANDWPTYWLQRISIAHSRHQAESITQLIGASLPTRFGLV